MNRYRQRHPDHAKAAKASGSTYGELTDGSELTAVASSVFAEAEEHRARVIAKDKAAKARRKGARR
jgi:hypothetical protein